MNKQRKRFLIKSLNRLGVYYFKGIEIEELSLHQLEQLHITESCKHLKVMQIQRKNHLAENKMAFA